jgi:mycothiol synthase
VRRRATRSRSSRHGAPGWRASGRSAGSRASGPKPRGLPLTTFHLRPLTLDDAEAVAALIAARNRVDFGETEHFDFSADELRDWWRLDEEKLGTDGLVAVSGDEVVGYARGSEERDLANLADESCVHPDHRGRGIGSALLDGAELWARKRGLGRFHVHVVNDDGVRLVESRGHRLVRYFWRMEIELAEPPAEPDAPEGYEIRGYMPGGDDMELHAMHQEAFAEHWEFTPEPLTDWLRWRDQRSDYDPAFWRLALAGDEIAGAALAFGDRQFGWILDLAVHPRHRKRGLGVTLLQSAFRALAERGNTRIGLEVDSENETGATRLYERAGMHVTRRYATYEKRLSP